MEELGRLNLFTSHFIIGCLTNINNDLESKKELNNWLKFKNSNSEMDKYRVNQTQYVDFLYEIDLSIFKGYLLGLVKNYKKAFPYAEKTDFINHVFVYSLFDLENFNEREYRFLGSYSTSSKYDFYCYYEVSSNEYLDFAIPSDKTIEYFKQYFKRIIQLVNDVQFEESLQLDEEVTTNEEYLSDLITHGQGEMIVKKIKVRFRNIRGKRLKLLLLAFQATGLLPKERIASKFHRCCDREFDWDIASYTAMNDYEFNDRADIKEFEEIKLFLEGLKG